MKNAFNATGISKRYHDERGKSFLALDNVNMHVHCGEFFVIIGPSGCGKSTLLRLLCGLDQQTTGTIARDPTCATDYGFVFQHFALMPWLTVEKNIEFNMIGRGVQQPERSRIVKQELKVFGLEHHAKSYPHELSGGMRQRVGLARAFAARPKMLFMDEPFSELDSFTAEELRQELLRIWHERNTTIVLVTHMMTEAIQLADRIAVMAGSPGMVRAVIDNHVPRPRDLRSPEAFALEDRLRGLVHSTH